MESKETGRTRRNPTLIEIARATGVSKSTVSLVLNNGPDAACITDATRRKVLEAAKRLGYRPNAAARSLVTGRSNAILMVAFDMLDEDLVARLKGAESYFVPRGYTLHLCTVDSKVGIGGYSAVIRSGRADGVLLTGLATPETYNLVRSLCEEADLYNVPVVALANAFPPDLIGTVAHIDDVSGAEQATAHLISHGHKRIALIGIADQPWSDARVRGYKIAHEKAGMPVDPNLIVLGDRTQVCAYRETLDLLQNQDFTAIFAITDPMAVAALSALHDSGKRVPEDIAIVGYNNDEKITAYTQPPLTTVANPFYEVGLAAAKMLIDMMEEQPVQPVNIPVSLVIRESCGCKPQR